ncbi:FAD-dependent monooxygenase, partial [Streptomyces sp. NPDC054956]
MTAAIALHRRGWHVTVCERSTELTGIGAGIVLAPNALRALDSIGLASALSTGKALPASLGLREPGGTWLSRSDGVSLPARYGPPARAVHRGFLIETLAAGLPDDLVQLGVAVTGVEDAGDAVTVRTSAGDLRADVVLGADGIHSPLRGQLFPRHPGLRHAGEAAWRTVVSGEGLPAQSAAETWGRGERFGVVPLADGRVYLFATVNTTAPEAGTRPAGGRLEPLRRFAEWHDPIP